MPVWTGIEGFGAATQAGTGGKEIWVTNLFDYGLGEDVIPGSLRWAIDDPDPRIIKFAVAGTVPLKRTLQVKSPWCTIDGFSVPYGGIQLVNAPGNSNRALWITANEVAVRGMRIRPGAAGPALEQQLDCIGVTGAQNVVIMFNDFWYGADELVDLWDVQNATVAYNVLAHALDDPWGTGKAHGLAFLVGNGSHSLTLDHNFMTHCRGRHPRIADAADLGVIDVVNNVILNPLDQPMTIDNSRMVNYKANKVIRGHNSKRDFMVEGSNGSVCYVSGNEQVGQTIRAQSVDTVQATGTPFPAPPVTTTTAAQAVTDVLAYAGAQPNDRLTEMVKGHLRYGGGEMINHPRRHGWPMMNCEIEVKQTGTVRNTDQFYAVVDFYVAGVKRHTEDFILQRNAEHKRYVGAVGPDGEILEPENFETWTVDIKYELLEIAGAFARRHVGDRLMTGLYTDRTARGRIRTSRADPNGWLKRDDVVGMLNRKIMV